MYIYMYMDLGCCGIDHCNIETMLLCKYILKEEKKGIAA